VMLTLTSAQALLTAALNSRGTVGDVPHGNVRDSGIFNAKDPSTLSLFRDNRKHSLVMVCFKIAVRFCTIWRIPVLKDLYSGALRFFKCIQQRSFIRSCRQENNEYGNGSRPFPKPRPFRPRYPLHQGELAVLLILATVNVHTPSRLVSILKLSMLGGLP